MSKISTHTHTHEIFKYKVNGSESTFGEARIIVKNLGYALEWK